MVLISYLPAVDKAVACKMMVAVITFQMVNFVAMDGSKN